MFQGTVPWPQARCSRSLPSLAAPRPVAYGGTSRLSRVCRGSRPQPCQDWGGRGRRGAKWAAGRRGRHVPGRLWGRRQSQHGPTSAGRAGPRSRLTLAMQVFGRLGRRAVPAAGPAPNGQEEDPSTAGQAPHLLTASLGPQFLTLQSYLLQGPTWRHLASTHTRQCRSCPRAFAQATFSARCTIHPSARLDPNGISREASPPHPPPS